MKLDGLKISGLKATHGPLTLKLGPFSKTVNPGPDERVGWGAMGFKIQLNGRTIVNLGDTLPHYEEWAGIIEPDILMIPIGGKTIHNTMDEMEGVEAVNLMQPKLVIPCHYNCPVFFSKNYNPADDQQFKKEVEKIGIECILLQNKESIEV